MENKILIVDDEKSFVEGLQKGLEDLADLFTTEICFSVDEAIERLKTTAYDLVITDLRMPKKNGIELLLYLREIKFPGCIKVMSAYETEETIYQAKQLGIVDIIAKPFALEWFKNMILESLEKKRQRESITLECDSLDILSVMQVVHMDKKNTAIQIEINDEKGFIYFQNGNIIDASFKNLRGRAAVIELASLNTGKISVQKMKTQVNHHINEPFVEFIMNIMKEVDEKRRDINDHENDSNSKEEIALGTKKAEIQEILSQMVEELEEIHGASIIESDGSLNSVENPDELDIETISGKFAMVNHLVTKTCRELSGGRVQETLIEEKKGWILLRPIGDTGACLLVMVGKEAALGNLRLVAKDTVNKLGKVLIPGN